MELLLFIQLVYVFLCVFLKTSCVQMKCQKFFKLFVLIFVVMHYHGVELLRNDLKVTAGVAVSDLICKTSCITFVLYFVMIFSIEHE